MIFLAHRCWLNLSEWESSWLPSFSLFRCESFLAAEPQTVISCHTLRSNSDAPWASLQLLPYCLASSGLANRRRKREARVILPTDSLRSGSNKCHLNSVWSPVALRGHGKWCHVCQGTTADIDSCIWRQLCISIGSTVLHCGEIVPAFRREARSDSLTQAQK